MEAFSFIGDQQQPGFNQPTKAPTIAEPYSYLSSGLTHVTEIFSNPNPADSYAGPDSGDDYSPIRDKDVLPSCSGSADWEDILRIPPCIWLDSEGPEEIIAAESKPGIEEVYFGRSSTLSLWPSHRISHPAAASNRPEVPVAKDIKFKGVSKKKGKYMSEIRIAVKIQQEKMSTTKKVWLGTFDTQVEAARANDVGKYFFKAGTHKNYFDPRIEGLLSTTSQPLQAEPLDALVVRVRHLAKHYGHHGTLPSSNLSISPVEM